jgi:hypothetical protein
MLGIRDIKINHDALGNQLNQTLLDAWLFIRQCNAGITITDAGEEQARYRTNQIEEVLLKQGVITLVI